MGWIVRFGIVGVKYDSSSDGTGDFRQISTIFKFLLWFPGHESIASLVKNLISWPICHSNFEEKIRMIFRWFFEIWLGMIARVGGLGIKISPLIF